MPKKTLGEVPDLLACVGRVASVSIRGKAPRKLRLVKVDLNAGMITLKTKTSVLFVPIDCAVLEFKS